MKASQHLMPALSAAAIAVMTCASAEAQAPAGAQSQPQAAAGAQAPARAPRGPVKTPLGRLPQEVLGMKVVVSDMVKSFEFYTKVIGLQPAKTLGAAAAGPPPTGSDPTKWPGEYGLNYSGQFSETFFDLLRPSASRKPTPESADMTTLMFKVPDARAVIARAKAMGYQIITEAPPVGPGEMSIGFIRDPDGYRVEILQAASYPK